MKRPIFLIFANAMILIVAFAMLTQLVFVVNLLAVAETVSGHVSFQRGGRGEYATLARGAFVKTGDVLRTTSDGSAEFVWAGGTRVKMMPNTQMVIQSAQSNGLRHSSTSRFRLERGKIFVRLTRNLAPSSRFEVQTKGAIASVRGTIFSVETQGEEGDTRIAVYRGTVQMASGDQKQLVGEGQAALAGVTDANGAAGANQIAVSRASQSEFAPESSITKPGLIARAKRVGGGAALLSGNAETGSILTINGQSVPILANGTFFRRVRLQPGHNSWTFVVTDRHADTQTITRTLDVPRSTLPATPRTSSVAPASLSHCASGIARSPS